VHQSRYQNNELPAGALIWINSIFDRPARTRT
jgi:hypothetical protein